MKIRKATREDCPGMMQLIRELAEYEKAPNEVTVDPMHFEESGFGEKPVWWAFVVENSEEIQVNDASSNPLLPRQMGQRHSSSGIGGVDHTSEASMRRGGSNPLIAIALYYIRYSTWKGQTMYLEDIIVTESMRGRGIGRMLIEQLIQEAKEKGFKRITWQVLDWNEPAIRFYKNMMLISMESGSMSN
jgi:ribosomal protein S18 acetylase RimI-like enzyme